MKKIDYSQFNQRDDVFQISLTELAFTIIFLILVLVGLTIKKSDEEMDVLIKRDIVENILTNIKEVVTEPNSLSNKNSTESLLKKLSENEEAKKNS